MEKKILISANVLFVIFTVWWVFNQLSFTPDNTIYVIYTYIYGILALIGGLAGLKLSQEWGGQKSYMGKAILAFSIGLLLQFFGQLVYSLYYMLEKQDLAYPSIGDVGYFGSVIAYIYGAWLILKIPKGGINFKLISNKLAIIIIPLGVLISSYYIFLQGYQFDWSKPLTIFLDFGYPLGEAIYVSLALIAFLVSFKSLSGVMKWRILLISFALFVQYIADFTFLYQASNYGSVPPAGDLYDLTYSIAYIVMINALFYLNSISLFKDSGSFSLPQYILSIYFFMLFIFWVILQRSGLKTDFWNYFYSFAFGLIPLVGGFYGIFIAKQWGWMQSSIGKAIFYISIGLFMWGVGDMIWAHYNFFENIAVPYPSLADIPFVLGFLFWAIGMVHMSKAMFAEFISRYKKLKFLLVVIPILATMLTYYLMVIVARQGVLISSFDGFKLFFDLAYPLTDLLILTMSLIIFGLSINFLAGTFKLPVLAILLGFFCNYFADFVFSYTTTVETYFNGGLADLLFTIATFLITFGIMGFHKSNKKISFESYKYLTNG